MTTDQIEIPGCIAHLQTNTEWGGGENQVLQLLVALRKRQVAALLWANPDGVLYQRAAEQGIPVHSLPAGVDGWCCRGCVAALCASLKAADVSLVHVHDSAGLDLGIRVRRRMGIPLVYNRRIASPIRAGWFSQRKYSPRNIDAVIAISETVKQVMAASCGYPAERIHIAPTGVDVAVLEAVQPDADWRRQQGGRWIAGGLGRLAPKKNWAFLVRTAAACRESLPDLRWVVAGEGPDRERLERLARELGVDDIVRFIGFRADGPRILRSLDLLFFPSLREGASVTIREAMVMGVPVAAMNADGSMESLAGNGWILRPDDVDGAARTVQSILCDAAGCERVIRAARESACQRFTFDRTASDTLAVYRRLLDYASKN